jgi:hypothetical protein
VKPCLPGTTTEITSRETGEAVSVYVAQPTNDTGGWWLHISATTKDGTFFLRRVVLTAPFRHLGRVVARLLEPGALSWKVMVEPPSGAPSAIRVGLVACRREEAASDTPATDKGLSYASGGAPATVTVPPGARVREASMIAGPAGGTFQVTVWRSATTTAALPAIAVPASTSFSLPAPELEDAVIASVTVAGDVAGYLVAWVE